MKPPTKVGQRKVIQCTSESQTPFGLLVDGRAMTFTEVGQFVELEGQRTSIAEDAPLTWKVVRIGRAGHACGGCA